MWPSSSVARSWCCSVPVDELIPDALDGERLDRVVALVADVSRSVAASAIAQGGVTLDGEATQRSTRVHAGQRVIIDDSIADPPPSPEPDASVSVTKLHVDDDVIVIDKAPGQVVHPGAGHTTGTIVQGLLADYPEIASIGEPPRPGVVHRLDKGTSGVFVVARSVRGFESLSRQLRDRTVHRRYLALVWGVPDAARGLIDAPIARAVRDPTRMTVRDDGKAARTSYEVEATWHSPDVSLVTCELETGRTHQIRVHMAAIGHPVVGDQKYGGDRVAVAAFRPALHAAELGFVHPAGDLVEFRSPLPDDVRKIVAELGPPESGEAPNGVG